MNIHVPQTEEAQAEAELLMKVQDNILSPRNGNPLITPDLDQITGLYLLSLDDFVVTKKEACNLLNAARVYSEVSKSIVNGKEIYSSILPEKFDCEIESKGGNKVRIKNGKLQDGFLDAHANRVIVRKIFDEFGSDEARKYIDKATMLSVELAYRYGFSLSLRDYYLPESAIEEITKLYEEGRVKLNELVKKYKMKKLERLPGKTLKETLEEQVMNIVELIRFHCWSIVKEKIAKTQIEINGRIFEHNASLLMASAGVKNKPINVVQMTALVGQQAVRGKRPAAVFLPRCRRKGQRSRQGREPREDGLHAKAFDKRAAGFDCKGRRERSRQRRQDRAVQVRRGRNRPVDRQANRLRRASRRHRSPEHRRAWHSNDSKNFPLRWSSITSATWFHSSRRNPQSPRSPLWIPVRP